jgi:hypothetical protein
MVVGNSLKYLRSVRKKDESLERNKGVSLFQIIILILSSVAIAYFIGALQTPIVSASEFFPTGCCLEDNEGAICQEMLLSDSDLCKSGLVASRCENVDQCRVGCCYNKNEGTCSLNAPREACSDGGGEWLDDSSCNVQQCSLGCCVLGDTSSITTTRECTLLSDELKFDKDFRNLDADGTCESYIGQSELGACLIETSDFSGENDCSFTTRGSCNGEFIIGRLCTDPDLKTTCLRSEKTMCVEGRDEVFFQDTCGNRANVYDADKVDDVDYWGRYIKSSSSEICSSASGTCGNCDYLEGSRCYEYRQGQDEKPDYGNYVCRDLSCDNGRQHGESWCVYDYDVNKLGSSPVGSRNFKANCINGDINIEGCADFNQEICIQSEPGNSNFQEARCVVNDWRSCLEANEKETYQAVEAECNKYEQCVMFLDIEGNEEFDGLPGFKRDVANNQQGSLGDIGKDANSVLTHCVPKYTPGFQFWNDGLIEEEVRFGSGGSEDEADALCALGGFTCVTERDKPDQSSGWDWKEHRSCIIDASSEEEVQKLIAGLNQRCQSIGSCGVKANVIGEAGGKGSYEIIRTKIDKKGKVVDNLDLEGYELSEDYLGGLGDVGIVKPGSIPSLSGLVIWLGVVPASSAIYGSSGFFTGVGAGLQTIGAVALAAVSAYYVGQMMGKMFGMSPGQTEALSLSLAAGVATAGVGGVILGGTSLGKAFAACGGNPFCVVAVIIVVVLTYAFTGGEKEYYILEYQCESWNAPQQGECSLCNDDVRPCTEYRCKSLGVNCQYSNENGEPGFCSTVSDTWSALIDPWPEVLTDKHEYVEVYDRGFKIENSESSDGELEAWKPIEFGIITDKPAECKIDTLHTDNYGDMTYNFLIEEDFETGKLDSRHHKITISPHAINGTGTLGMSEGENRYFVRCKNYAGEVNEAEYAISLILGKGPDVRQPIITRFYPEGGSYVMKNVSERDVWVYVDEPAVCKYSQETDLSFQSMTRNMTCLDQENLGVNGEWVCSSTLEGLQSGSNRFYFKCEDKAGNFNSQSTEYVINTCEKDLEITSLSLSEDVVAGKAPVELELDVYTQGCVDEAQCFYSFNNSYIKFLETDSDVHKQVFDLIQEGDYGMDIRCEDEAGNIVNQTVKFSVELDNEPPEVIRTFKDGDRLKVVTNEEAECSFSHDKKSKCDFEFGDKNSTLLIVEKGGINHFAPWVSNKNYYIKCKDVFGNENTACGIVVGT